MNDCAALWAAYWALASLSEPTETSEQTKAELMAELDLDQAGGRRAPNRAAGARAERQEHMDVLSRRWLGLSALERERRIVEAFGGTERLGNKDLAERVTEALECEPDAANCIREYIGNETRRMAKVGALTVERGQWGKTRVRYHLPALSPELEDLERRLGEAA